MTQKKINVLLHLNITAVITVTFYNASLYKKMCEIPFNVKVKL